jgi:exosortase/archaeosortase family protein
MFKEISKYVDLSFLLRFLALFVPAYLFHTAYLGITDPNNYYNAFLDQNLNYIKWATASINHTAGVITHFFGVDATVDGRLFYVQNGARVLLEFPCLGLGIMSFWVAFIVAHNVATAKKVLWSLGGVLAIWVLNCFRIAILLISMQNSWRTNSYFDHHDIFNFVSYILIGLLIYRFYATTNKNVSAAKVIAC